MTRFRRQTIAEPGVRPLRRRGAVAVFPALFTLGNCICGFASLHYAALGDPKPSPDITPPLISNYAIAGYFIFAAMVMDLFDGFIARLARATSDFGAELDSLADMVSFGVAPAVLTTELIADLLSKAYRIEGARGPYDFMGPNADDVVGKLFWMIAALYVACTALRLARFNVQNKHDVLAHQAFRGLPSPGAAGIVASSIIFFETLHSSRHLFPLHLSAEYRDLLTLFFPYVMPAILLGAALLMVSRFQYAHLINRFLRGRRRFNYLVGLLCVILLTLWQPQLTALLAIYVYVLSAPVTWLYHKISPRPPAVPLATTPERTIGQGR